MPVKIEMTLSSHQRIPLWGHGGKAAHGLVLNLFSEINPRLAEYLHRDLPVKPFTTAVQSSFYQIEKGRYIPVDHPFTITLTGLDTISEELLEETCRFIIEHHPRLTFAGVPDIQLQNIKTTIESDEDILTDAHPNTMVELDFLTPTGFRSSGEQILFPIPDLVFSSLARKWNAFSQSMIRIDESAVSREVRVQQYMLRTEMLEFGSFRQIGFVGTVRYNLKKLLPDHRRIITALCRYAQYAGVGAKTTMGMGRCMPVQKRDY